MPRVSRSTTPSFQSFIAAASISGSASTPISAADPASWARPVPESSAFEGIQPRLRQAPP
jgi:hypothetical protein